MPLKPREQAILDYRNQAKLEWENKIKKLNEATYEPGSIEDFRKQMFNSMNRDYLETQAENSKQLTKPLIDEWDTRKQSVLNDIAALKKDGLVMGAPVTTAIERMPLSDSIIPNVSDDVPVLN